MKLRNSLLLLLTATIWGTAFVAQSVGMEYVGPLTYVCTRSIIGSIVLLPVIAVLRRVGPPRASVSLEERRKGRKTLLLGGACCGTVLCIASTTQQITLLYTSVGKAGFMTACYILVVPVLGLLFGRRCGLKHWCSVAIALVGLYFLCMAAASASTPARCSDSAARCCFPCIFWSSTTFRRWWTACRCRAFSSQSARSFRALRC